MDAVCFIRFVEKILCICFMRFVEMILLILAVSTNVWEQSAGFMRPEIRLVNNKQIVLFV